MRDFVTFTVTHTAQTVVARSHIDVCDAHNSLHLRFMSVTFLWQMAGRNAYVNVTNFC